MNAIVFFAVLVLGAPAPKDKPNPSEELVGLWELERTESNAAQPMPKSEGPIRYRFTKDGAFKVLEGDKEIGQLMGFKFDPKADPPTLDLRISKVADPMVLGIYKIEGDKLTLCKGLPGEVRPAQFSVPTGSTNYLLIFRRVKTKD